MGSIPSEQRFRAQQVCVIGAGPSGLAAAKYLQAENAFSRIVVFEQRSDVGGLWNHVPCDEVASKQLSIPQTSPHTSPERPIWKQDDHSRDVATFMSPIYDRLETNIPTENLMKYSDLDWPSDWQLFPEHFRVLEYIKQYAKEVRPLIELETQVLKVRQTDQESWAVTTQKLTPSGDGPVREDSFDAVIVANGHYAVPYIPDVKAVREWNERYPGVITHAKFYRKPEHYTGKKVIIVGNSASGTDIGAQVMPYCQSPMLMSQKSESFLLTDDNPSKLEKPEIEEYILENRSVRFVDGTVESDVDAIIYCTGYFYSYPFLDSLEPPVITTGERVENTYQHIFYRPNPTLAFLSLNQKVIPFPVAEAQAAVAARVFAGRLPLPSESEMEEWEKATVDEWGTSTAFHVLKFPRDADYINMLHDWAFSADGKTGKCPPHWGDVEYWIRERFPSIKKAFQDAGEARRDKKTLKDVGFDFEKYKAEAELEEKQL